MGDSLLFPINSPIHIYYSYFWIIRVPYDCPFYCIQRFYDSPQPRCCSRINLHRRFIQADSRYSSRNRSIGIGYRPDLHIIQIVAVCYWREIRINIHGQISNSSRFIELKIPRCLLPSRSIHRRPSYHYHLFGHSVHLVLQTNSELLPRCRAGSQLPPSRIVVFFTILYARE
ncbi:hypothetical protein D3C73_849120 [compost metagenome]